MLSRCIHRPIFPLIRPPLSLYHISTTKNQQLHSSLNPRKENTATPLQDHYDSPILTHGLLSRKEGRPRRCGLALANVLATLEEIPQEDPRRQTYYVAIISHFAKLGLNRLVDILIRCMLVEETPITKETWAAIIQTGKFGSHVWKLHGISSSMRLEILLVRSETGERPNHFSMLSLLEAMKDNVLRKDGMRNAQAEELEWVLRRYIEAYGTPIPVDLWAPVLEAYMGKGLFEETKRAFEAVTRTPSYKESYTLQRYLDSSLSPLGSGSYPGLDTVPAIICIRPIVHQLALKISTKKVSVAYLDYFLSKLDANRLFRAEEWNDVLSILLRCREYDHAFRLFEEMPCISESPDIRIPNGQTFQTLVSAYPDMQRRLDEGDPLLTKYSPRSLLSSIFLLDKQLGAGSTSRLCIFDPPTLNAFLSILMPQRDYAAAYVALSLFNPTAFTSTPNQSPLQESLTDTTSALTPWLPGTKACITDPLLRRIKTGVKMASADSSRGKLEKYLKRISLEEGENEDMPLYNLKAQERHREKTFYATFLGPGKVRQTKMGELFILKITSVRSSLSLGRYPSAIHLELAAFKHLLLDALAAEIMSGLVDARTMSMTDRQVREAVEQQIKGCIMEVTGKEERVELGWEPLRDGKSMSGTGTGSDDGWGGVAGGMKRRNWERK
ncbi:hypothetical protein M422DRAFT_41801 [Sphaerobolus stellatus SS14]|nr:hypothetical protein M422DRAFT_41801 [Sphaerobolus stellatus SS14]